MDTLHNAVREVETSLDQIETVVGNGRVTSAATALRLQAAELYNPMAVAVDSGAETYSSRTAPTMSSAKSIRPRALITTIAGKFALGDGYSGDGRAATAAQARRSDGHRRGCQRRHFHRRQRQQRGPRGRSFGHDHHNRGGLRLGAGYSGDGYAATAAQLNDPTGLAVNGQYLFISDTGNNVVRRVDLTSGTITTVAGDDASVPATAVTAMRPPAPSSTTLAASPSKTWGTSSSPTLATTSSARSMPRGRSQQLRGTTLWRRVQWRRRPADRPN